VILLGNTAPFTLHVPIDVRDVVVPAQRYTFRFYNSEKREWNAPVIRSGEALSGLAVSIECNGYRLIELTSNGHQ
jgi:hypothetical protein